MLPVGARAVAACQVVAAGEGSSIRCWPTGDAGLRRLVYTSAGSDAGPAGTCCGGAGDAGSTATPMRFLLPLGTAFGLLGAAVTSTAAAQAPVLPRGEDHRIDHDSPVMTRDQDGRVTVRAVRTEERIVLDGRLTEAVYRDSPPIDEFVQQEPREGRPATERTEVWLLFDDLHLYVAARCLDSRAGIMVANEMRRDSENLAQNDNFAVLLDTFHDQRNGFLFYTTPVGGLFDGYVTDERQVNGEWNTVWDARTARSDSGWTVEMAIPFRSLRYAASGAQTWGINLRRVIRSKNEFVYLSSVPAAYGPHGINRASAAATLTGVVAPRGGTSLEIKPYAMSRVDTDLEATPVVRNRPDANVGFDVKYGLARSLTFDFSYNTDFSQVESDEQQVNLTRFSLFFPERREFFLEGQGIFAFGGAEQGGRRRGGPPNETPMLFFSRRIGLEEVDDETRAVPIRTGLRLTGKAGSYSIGALNVQTAANGGAPAANFSVVRLKRNVLRRSTIGVIATARTPSSAASGANYVFGMDAGLAFFDNLSVDAYYARTRTPGLEGDDASYRGQLNYDSDRYGLRAERLVVQTNFNPEIGFVRRDDFRRSFLQARFSPRPAVAAIRKLRWEASLDRFTNGLGRLQTQKAEGTFRIEFAGGDDWSTDLTDNHEVLDEEFEITDGVILPVGSYRFREVQTRYRLGPARRISGSLSAGYGRFYNGTKTEVGYRGRLEINPQLSVEPGISVNWVDLPAGRFTTRLLSARAAYAMTPRAYLDTFVQFNSKDAALATNVRFRWEYQPGSEIFVVYSDGRNTVGPAFPALEQRSLAVKLTRLIRP